jgi:hypothetical protein
MARLPVLLTSDNTLVSQHSSESPAIDDPNHEVKTRE